MPRIRNPRAYAAAIKRNNQSSGRSTFKARYGGPKAYQKRLHGQGGYWGDKLSGAWSWLKKQVPKGTARKIGATLGKTVGMSDLGSSLGRTFAEMTGLGSYKVKKNTILDEGQGPPIVSNSHGNVRIRHREFISDINTSTAFTLQFSEGINAGNSSLFPWLADLAESFQQYRFHGLIFEFKSTSSDALNSTNTALGTLVMTTDYNVYATPPVNKQQMENQEYTVSCKPSISMIHAIECAPGQTTVPLLYTRIGPAPAGQDARLYDMGQFNLATVGSQASPVVGELWASYDCELLKPQLTLPLGLLASSAHYSGTGASNAGLFANPNLPGAGPGGSNNGIAPFDNIGLTFTGDSIVFPAGSEGNFLINYNWYGNTTGTWSAPGIINQGGAQNTTGQGNWPVFGFKNATSSIAAPNNTVAGNPLIQNVSLATTCVQLYSDTSSYCQMSGGNWPGLTGAWDLYVTQMNGNCPYNSGSQS